VTPPRLDPVLLCSESQQLQALRPQPSPRRLLFEREFVVAEATESGQTMATWVAQDHDSSSWMPVAGCPAWQLCGRHCVHLTSIAGPVRRLRACRTNCSGLASPGGADVVFSPPAGAHAAASTPVTQSARQAAVARSSIVASPSTTLVHGQTVLPCCNLAFSPTHFCRGLHRRSKATAREAVNIVVAAPSCLARAGREPGAALQ
jgi:hypothetical protein